MGEYSNWTTFSVYGCLELDCLWEGSAVHIGLIDSEC
jgi:hypothetical protein